MKSKKKYFICGAILILVLCIICGNLIINAIHKKQNAEEDRRQKEIIASLTDKELENFSFIGWNEEDLKVRSSSILNDMKDDRQIYINFHYPKSISNYNKKDILIGPNEKDTSLTKIYKRDEIIELAKKEVTLTYDIIHVYKDDTAEKWLIEFKDSTNNQIQNVYLYTNGSLHLVTQVLNITE